ncbi:omptin family outer membrane protease [Pseudomonas sp. UBA1879]|uniref:omptin family outer membrane protease n=1 Tax=Pseudomonas sp. UBA1879 TaxID=1947305 RepID=UPI0025FB86F2|nr:omptin family outer membrane protease [Pseudomonas sp. UBA1879]
MTVRKAWALFGVVVMGQEALAHAHVNQEQRFSVGDVEVSMGLGLLNGQSKEKVYDEGEKLSQLNWDLKQIPTLHLGVTFHPAEWLSLDARGWTQMGKGRSHMKDYDWLDGEDEPWTHYSDHPDTKVEKAWQAELAATVWALNRNDFALGAMLGYQRSELGWEAKGGQFTYSSDDDFRDLSGNLPAELKVISYEQRFDTPYVGLVGLYSHENWTLEGRFKYSQWVKARDYDQHHLRLTTFTGNNGNRGRMQSVALGLSYRASPQLSIKAGIDYQTYAESKGSTLIDDRDEGERYRVGGKAGSQASRTVLSTLALNYRF